MVATPESLKNDVGSVFKREVSRKDVTNVADLRHNMEQIPFKRGMRRQGTTMGAMSNSDVALAIPRFYDPMEYWDLSGLPWNMADEGHRHKLHKWMRLYYSTHRLVPTLIDIYTRFPLAGLELYSKDKKLTQYYEDLFLDDLNYEDFLVSLGREYWLIGEAFAMGHFNEWEGVWEHEELLNPEDIVVERIPFVQDFTQLKVVPPDYLKRMVQSRQPAKYYKLFEENFGELIPYIRREEAFPISDVNLKQVAFRVADWDAHGTPLLLRGLRTLLHEEKLLASQDAIAERLYSPLILAKLGIQDMGPNALPWIPSAADIESFRDDMDYALSSDFRLIVHHFGLDVQNVFGREEMPDLGNDFDRIDRWIMQIFGINPSLLGGGAADQPYATSALNAEFMNQMLRTYQKFLKRHFENRAKVVAEAQEHWDYEKRGQTRIPIYEEVIIEDPETGKSRIEKVRKVMVPEMQMETLDVRDEATERQFLQVLRSLGVPISDERLMIGVSFEFKDTLDEMQEEMIQKTVATQMAKMQTFKICAGQGLPIPPDLYMEVMGMAQQGQQQAAPPGSAGDMGSPGQVDVGAPGQGTVMFPAPPPDIMDGGMGPGGAGGPVPGGGPPPATPMSGGPAGSVPDISNERRPGMPTAASHSKDDFPIIAYGKTPDGEDGYIVKVSAKSLDKLDDGIRKCSAILNDIEIQKRQRKLRENRYAGQIDEDLDWDMSKQVVVSKISPKARKSLLDEATEPEE